MVHAATEAAAEEAVRAIQQAYTLGETEPPEPALILKRIG